MEEKGFRLDNLHNTTCYATRSEDRVRNGAKKLCKSKQTSTQGRVDSFFKVVPSPSAQAKRKVGETVCSNVMQSTTLGQRHSFQRSRKEEDKDGPWKITSHQFVQLCDFVSRQLKESVTYGLLHTSHFSCPNSLHFFLKRLMEHGQSALNGCNVTMATLTTLQWLLPVLTPCRLLLTSTLRWAVLSSN